MAEILPKGLYPFIDQRFNLEDMAMIEAPAELEALIKAQALANGVEIIRDRPVELTCSSEAYLDATFLVWWPHDSARIHILAPKEFAKGRA